MQFLTVKSMAEKWGITERRIVSLLRANRIPGAVKNGMSWQIPADAVKPYDKRARYSKYEKKARRVVIAGIDSGIGQALAKILTEHGFDIIGLYQKKSVGGGNLMTTIRENIDVKNFGPNVQLIEVDYFDRASLLAACDSIQGHLDGFVFLEIFFNLEDTLFFNYDEFERSFEGNVFAMNLLVRELVKKMNYSSSIVIQNSVEAFRGSFGASAYAATQAAKDNLVKTYANVFSELYGVRVNSLAAGWIGGVMETNEAFNKIKQGIPMKRLGIPEEIADDIFLLLTRHKYMTGTNLVSDGGYLSFDAEAHSEDMDSGKFYVWLHKFITGTKVGDTIWATSTMMDNEWTDSAMERQFKQDNLDAVQRGVKLKRIFLFPKKYIKKFRSNPNITTYSTNNKVEAMWVDSDEVRAHAPELLDVLGDGWIGINEDVLLVDLPAGKNGESRGYATMNKKEILAAKKAFNGFKKFAKPLKGAWGGVE
ncbi:MAG: SDR family oxidoreductase [Alphaproteobacteria bacterium]|nr:SDR family oxidoreductase [Alphaproteobacteria bacterium]